MASGVIKGKNRTTELKEINVRYAGSTSSTLSTSSTYSMTKRTNPAFPDGYVICGIKAMQSTTVTYNSSTSSPKANVNSYIIPTMINTAYLTVWPASISAKATGSYSSSGMKYMERTITFILMPEELIP